LVKIFGKKKKEVITNTSGSVSIDASVYFGGSKIGDIMYVRAKEIKGQDYMEMLIRLEVGSGIEPQIVQVLAKQGLHIGRPANDY